jgi:putative transposase
MLCIKDRRKLLGKVVGAAIGRPYDKYIIIPNHIHMILIIDNNGRAMRAPTISTVINQFKGYATKQIEFSIWRKLFFEHIIPDKEDYQIKWNYIDYSDSWNIYRYPEKP